MARFIPRVSKVMVLGWLTLLVAILATPQFVALVPEPSLPFVTCAAGAVTLLVRWLGGNLGVNPLTGVGALVLIAGLLGIPDLVAVIPPAWMPLATGISAVCTLIARFQAGQSWIDKAAPVNLLMTTGGGTV